jgi:hypothetical protein
VSGCVAPAALFFEHVKHAESFVINSVNSEVAPRRRPALPWIIGGIVTLVMLLAVASIGGVVWLGLNTFHEQAETAIRADPVVVDALGSITNVELDFTATGNAEGEEEFAYRVTGERASGLLVGRFVTVDADTEDLREGTLTLDDGRVINIGTALRAD